MRLSPPKPSARSVRILAIALGVLIAAAWMTLRVLLPPERVLTLARAQLASSLRREVRLDRASVSLWPPVRAALHGVAIGEPGGLARGALFRATEIDLDLDPFALLAHRLLIRSLTLDAPALHLILHADGTSNLDSLASTAPGRAGAGAPLDLAIRTLTIRNGELVVDDLRAGRRSALHLESRISLAIGSQARVATAGRSTLSGFARGPLTATHRADLGRSLADLTLTIDHRGTYDPALKRLALEQLALGFGRARMNFAGVIDQPGPRPRLRLSARGSDVQFGELLRALSAAELPALHGVTGTGRMDFDLQIEGALGPGRFPAVRGALGIRDASFHYPKAPASVSALSFVARFAPDSLVIGDLRARVADQPVRGTLALTHFANPEARFRLQGAVDLAAVAPLVAPPGSEVSGRATLDVSGAGPARDPGALALAGRAELSGVRIATPQLAKPVERISGTVEFSGTHATVKRFTGSAGQSSFALDATVEHPLVMMAKPNERPPAQVDFALTSPYLDLTELLPPTPGPLLLPNARGSGRIAIGRLKRQKLDASNVRANVTFDPTSLTAPQFDLDGYGGRISGSAKFDLRNPAAPGYSLRAKVDSVQADALLSAWTPAKNLMKGALSTTFELAGDGTAPDQIRRTLTAIGLAHVTRGELGPTPALAAIAKLTGVPSFERLTFRELKLPFEVRNGRIATRELDIHSASSDWKATGLLGFDGALDYTVSTLVPADQVAQLGADAARAAGALADPQGRIHMSFRLTGTARNPRVALDPQALRDDLAGHLQNTLGDQAKKIEQQLRQAITPADSSGRPGTVNIQAVAESLKKIKGSDLLDQILGKKKKKPPPPADTTHRAADSTKS